ncbi:hypothetical protein M011DRAFT_465923 [Sporormia fimetaria CBS 119925]|uniref:Ubiquitin-like domain-containing protein n=1 Tax=Sporormia fimetaria CBS 119925 TaxID=1340428 RepID=A0A6A6VIW7_9PLEO|nr:hypothetical protein M011DRAFT_465923 [Sporormia fimetaria CBS 119925]
MTDTEAPKPKKRTFFKKAAWQEKKEEDDQRDIFRHADTFRDIVAEENRRKQEEKERKRQEEEQRKQRKRKLEEAAKLEEEERKRRLRSPTDNYDSHSDRKPKRRTRSSQTTPPPTFSPYSAPPGGLSNIIDLGDPSSESEASPVKLGNNSLPQASTRSSSRNQPSAAPVIANPPDDDLDLEEDEHFKEARLRAAKRAETQVDHIVQLLITSYIDGTAPLMVKIKTSSTLEKPLDAWCARQNFTAEQTKSVFLTWKSKPVSKFSTVRRLGVKIDESGNLSLEGSCELYDEDNLPKIHVEAWTDDVFKEWKTQQEEEAAARERAASLAAAPEPEPEPEPEPAQVKIRLILKAQQKPDFKITVRPETTVEHLTEAYKQKNNIPRDQPVTLKFDGDRLRPMDTMTDTVVEDMDSIEVYFK